MQIKFHGAAGTVTGSCYELKDDDLGVHILVDCGMLQGEAGALAHNEGEFPFDARSLTHLIITHAHLDHIGLVPKLYGAGFRGRVFAMSETTRLAELSLGDAANRGGKADQRIFKSIDFSSWKEPAPGGFGHVHPIARDVFLRAFRSAHIPGAVSVSVLWGPREAQKSITFSGDIGPNKEDEEVLPLLGHRMSPAKADFLVVESTYGGVVREPISTDERLDALDAILEVALFKRQGVVLMPAFAVHRTPTILADLTLLFARRYEKYKNIHVHLDSFQALRAMEVEADAYKRTYLVKKGTKVVDAWLGRGMYRELGLDYRDADDRALLLDCLHEMLMTGHQPAVERRGQTQHWRRIWWPVSRKFGVHERIEGPAIVIAGQGMCDAGAIQDYLARLLPLASTTVLFSGYCGAGTVGGKLAAIRALPLEERRRLNDTVNLLDEEFPLSSVQAEIELLSGYSGHADQEGLLDWLWSGPPGKAKHLVGDTLFITHGNESARRALKAAIEERAAERGESPSVRLPMVGDDWFNLDLSEEQLREQRIAELKAELATLQGATG